MGSTALRRPARAVAALVGILGAHALVPVHRQPKNPPIPLTSTFAAIRAPFDTSRAANYAVCAKRAINDGALDKARKTYEYYVEAWAARDPVHDAAPGAYDMCRSVWWSEPGPNTWRRVTSGGRTPCTSQGITTTRSAPPRSDRRLD